MNKKKGLLFKMLLSIGLPVAIIFAIVAGISLYVVNQSITRITSDELSARSQAVSNEIDSYFTKYLEVANQLSTTRRFKACLIRSVRALASTQPQIFPK